MNKINSCINSLFLKIIFFPHLRTSKPLLLKIKNFKKYNFDVRAYYQKITNILFILIKIALF